MPSFMKIGQHDFSPAISRVRYRPNLSVYTLKTCELTLSLRQDDVGKLHHIVGSVSHKTENRGLLLYTPKAGMVVCREHK